MTHRMRLLRLGHGRAGYATASLVAGLAGVGVATWAGLASAKSPTTLSIAKNVPVKSAIDNVVVNLHGVTVYTLSGESARHLKCTKANTCLDFWFPVKASSAKAKLSAAQGIKGKLGKLHRNGVYQVTLGGRPLYTFIKDHAKQGSATGEGIVSFGGTWHVIAVKSSSPKTTPTTPTTPTTTPTTSTTTTTTTPPYTTPTYTYP